MTAPARAVPGALAMFWLLTRLRLRRLDAGLLQAEMDEMI